MTVAVFVRARKAHPPTGDRIFDRAHDQPLAELGRAQVAELDQLREVVTGVDIQERERKAARPESFLGETQHHERILAARKEQHRVRTLGGDLAHDVNRFGLEPLEVVMLRGGTRLRRLNRVQLNAR